MKVNLNAPAMAADFTPPALISKARPPRPLERYKIGLNADGEILIDKTKKFQQEKGEWSDADSFLRV